MKILKTLLKWLLIISLFVGVGLFITVKVMSEDKPVAIDSKSGDALAQSVLVALNKPAWDTLNYLKWEFKGGHKYVWDKKNNNARIQWDGITVVMDLDAQRGVVHHNGKKVEGTKSEKHISKAWSIWCNDSFWMFAPFKLFDKGTSRTVVKDADGSDALMVTYDSGGVTPGDTYVWSLDDNNRPTAYKMWVKIIPVGGMKMTWENWKTLQGGAQVAISHKSNILSFDMKDVKGGNTLNEIGVSDNIFDLL